MINVLATALMTGAVIFMIGFLATIVCNGNVNALRAFRGMILAMDAIALTSTVFAGGNIALAVATFAFTAISLPGEFTGENLNSMISSVIIEGLSITAGVVLIILR